MGDRRGSVPRIVGIPVLVAALLLVGCARPGPPGPPCAVAASYTFGWSGGLTHRDLIATLVPPDTLRLVQRRMFEDTTLSCVTVLPSCGSEGGPHVGAVRGALEHPDVAAAFAGEERFFGRDLRPVDAPAWRIEKRPAEGDPVAFLVGESCDGATTCDPIPPGVADLEDLLTTVVERQMELPACRDLGSR